MTYFMVPPGFVRHQYFMRRWTYGMCGGRGYGHAAVNFLRTRLGTQIPQRSKLDFERVGDLGVRTVFGTSPSVEPRSLWLTASRAPSSSDPSGFPIQSDTANARKRALASVAIESNLSWRKIA